MRGSIIIAFAVVVVVISPILLITVLSYCLLIHNSTWWLHLNFDLVQLTMDSKNSLFGYSRVVFTGYLDPDSFIKVLEIVLPVHIQQDTKCGCDLVQQ